MKGEVKMVAIHTKYMTRNNCYVANKQITVKKLVLHSTAARGVMAKDWFSRWNKPYPELSRLVCVHAFVDDKEAWQYLPWNHRGWHAGGDANNFAIGVEMCEDRYHTKEFADKTVKNAAELFAFLCKKFNLDPMKDIFSHSEGYKLGVCSNHADPEHWITKFGYTMDKFRRMVADIMKAESAPNVMYRVIVDEKQIMVLSTVEGAKAELTKLVKEGQVGTVERNTDSEVMYTIDRTYKTVAEPVEMYRVIVDGEQKLALSVFEKAKAELIALTPEGKSGIVQRKSDKKTMFSYSNIVIKKPLATWEQHINGQEVRDLQNAVNKYFGDKRLVVDGFYGDNTKEGVPNGIRHGMKKYEIIGEIQKRLTKLGFYKMTIDSSFGDGTLKAVIDFQRARGFAKEDVDGIVGKFTFSELYKK